MTVLLSILAILFLVLAVGLPLIEKYSTEKTDEELGTDDAVHACFNGCSHYRHGYTLFNGLVSLPQRSRFSYSPTSECEVNSA